MKKVIFTKGFPLQDSKCTQSSLINRVVLGIGSNQGKSLVIFTHLLFWFINNHKFYVVNTTPIYQNPAFGYTNQPDFFNALVVLRTSLNVVEIFRLIFYLERKFGRQRKRSFKNAPRFLDIDLIFFNQLILKRPYLTIPHKQYQNRASIFIPMILQTKRWK